VPLYSIIMNRDRTLTEEVTIEVTASTDAEARASAVVIAESKSLTWEPAAYGPPAEAEILLVTVLAEDDDTEE